MKTIKLLAPRVIGGAVRYPAEGAISVNADEANRLIKDDAAEEVDAPAKKKEPTK